MMTKEEVVDVLLVHIANSFYHGENKAEKALKSGKTEDDDKMIEAFKKALDLLTELPIFIPDNEKALSKICRRSGQKKKPDK